jgi:predicted deacetylase
MIPARPQYLLRIDDLCPSVSAERWVKLQSLIEEFCLQPILAVVPDNQDPELRVSPPDPEFWCGMRAFEAAGAVIGLHGYRHLCLSRGRSLLGLHRLSEFAGVCAETQRLWIHDGLHILRGHGLNPRVWVAPRHGFDAHTLDALRAEEVSVLSDGFAPTLFRRDGLIWIPQQLWGPVEKTCGLWTICIHPNTTTDAELARLREFLVTHSAEFTSLDHVLFAFQPAALTLPERIQADVALWRFKTSRALRGILSPALFRSSKPS